MRAALDTNVLVYAEGVGDSKRVSTSRELLDGALAADLVIPVQCLGELFRVQPAKQADPENKRSSAYSAGWMLSRWRPRLPMPGPEPWICASPINSAAGTP
jgi:hypothetical protein